MFYQRNKSFRLVKNKKIFRFLTWLKIPKSQSLIIQQPICNPVHEKLNYHLLSLNQENYTHFKKRNGESSNINNSFRCTPISTKNSTNNILKNRMSHIKYYHHHLHTDKSHQNIYKLSSILSHWPNLAIATQTCIKCYIFCQVTVIIIILHTCDCFV